MDIGSENTWPSGALSNFTPHAFVFDEVVCACMEGFLQALKFDDPQIQIEVCGLDGVSAKRRGRKRNKTWKSVQQLWWQEQVFDRDGVEFQGLLDRAFAALARNANFQQALLATGNVVLTHSIGKSKTCDTVLTEAEFCSRLMKIRKQLNRS